MRVDLLIFVIGLLLLVAMVLTLVFGREYSRHGYGSVVPEPEMSPLTGVLLSQSLTPYPFDFSF